MKESAVIGLVLGGTALAVGGAIYYLHEKANAAAASTSGGTPPGSALPATPATFALTPGSNSIYVPATPTTYSITLPSGGMWNSLVDSTGAAVGGSVSGQSGAVSATYNGTPATSATHANTWLTATWTDSTGAMQTSTVQV